MKFGLIHLVVIEEKILNLRDLDQGQFVCVEA